MNLAPPKPIEFPLFHELHFFSPWKALFRDLLGPLPRDVLDVGSGSGDLVFLFHSLGHNGWGVDFDEGTVEASRRLARARGYAVDFRYGTPNDLPLPPCCLDAVHGRLDRLEGSGEEAVLAEWLRVLRPGGTLILTKPAALGKGAPVTPRWRTTFGRAAGFLRLPLSFGEEEEGSGMGAVRMNEAEALLRRHGLDRVSSTDLSDQDRAGRKRLPWFLRPAPAAPTHFAVWGRKHGGLSLPRKRRK
jgi:SAM-dependent methyltransferase